MIGWCRNTVLAIPHMFHTQLLFEKLLLIREFYFSDLLFLAFIYLFKLPHKSRPLNELKRYVYKVAFLLYYVDTEVRMKHRCIIEFLPAEKLATTDTC